MVSKDEKTCILRFNIIQNSYKIKHVGSMVQTKNIITNNILTRRLDWDIIPNRNNFTKIIYNIYIYKVAPVQADEKPSS